MTDIYQFLREHRIDYQRYDHPAVFTVADVERLIPDLPGTKTKNLFLCDKKGRHHFLVVVGHDLRVELKALRELLGLPSLRFASAARLRRYLGVEPGSVSFLALFNDTSQEVCAVMDERLWHAEAYQFHPLVNTVTLYITKAAVERFAAATGHNLHVLKVPGTFNPDTGSKTGPKNDP